MNKFCQVLIEKIELYSRQLLNIIRINVKQVKKQHSWYFQIKKEHFEKLGCHDNL